MLTERDEFLLSRLQDGDLNEDEHAHVQTLLASSAAAREMVDSYGALAGVLVAERVPDLDVSAGVASVLAAVREEAVAERTAEVTRQPSFWQQARRRVAIAAAMLAGVAVGIHYLAPSSPTATVADDAKPTGTLIVTGPTTDVPAGKFDVQIGPSSAIAGMPAEQLYANEFAHGRSRVEIRPESQSAKDTTGHDPF